MQETIKQKWERRYDTYLKLGDQLQDKLDTLDILADWVKYNPTRQAMMSCYEKATLISQFLEDMVLLQKDI
jgi:hypothetical protein